MTNEKWLDTIGKIKDAFPVLEEKEEVSPEPGIDRRHFIIFEGPLGKTKLECIVRPKVIGQKVITSKRIGSHTTVEYLYSPDEKVYHISAYQWDTVSNIWVKMEKGGFDA